MTVPVIINTAAIQYASATTECHCSFTAQSVMGTTTFTQVVVLDSTTLPEDWTDAELCEAVAEKLNIPVDDVMVANQS